MPMNNQLDFDLLTLTDDHTRNCQQWFEVAFKSSLASICKLS